jgi:C4-dicarboxylate transporter, DctM subunit
MEGPWVGLLGIIVMLVLMFLGMPIGFSLIFVGTVGFAIVRGVGPALVNLWMIPPRLVGNYDMAVLPLFLLMGALVASAGISRDLFRSAYSWVGHRRGGLAMATILACAGFAAVCGSSPAEAAAMGKIVGPEMKKYKYDPRLAAGSIACGGTLAILIPPSLGFIVYAILTEQSVGRLFIAGIFPGITVVIFYLIVIHILCWRNPLMGPAGPKTSFKTKLIESRTVWPMVALFVLVIGGIYAGIFTPTEAGGVGAFGAIVIGLILKRFTGKSFWGALAETGELTAMMLILFVGATIFNQFMSASQLPFMLANWINSLTLPVHLILAMILFMYLLMGCFFDIIAGMVLTLPIIFPIIQSMHLDPIWYGVLMVRMIEIGLVSPPFGLNDFIIAGVMKIPLGTIYRGVIPFVIADLFNTALLVAFPQISLFLPNLMKGG